MTNFLSQIKTGKENNPRRCFLYAIHGFGKSTFASKAPNPIFIQTEDGLDNIDTNKFPLARDFRTVMGMLTSLMGDHDFKTLVIDTVDWLEILIFNEVVAYYNQKDDKKNVENIAEIPYGEGYGIAMTYWDRFKYALNTIREKKGMHIILLAHSKIERYNSPDVEAYDRYSPKLNKKASLYLQEWADEVFFGNFKVKAMEVGDGFDKKKKGIGSGIRILHTNESPAYLAKNRLGIKNNIDATWGSYEAHFSIGNNAKTTKGDK